MDFAPVLVNMILFLTILRAVGGSTKCNDKLEISYSAQNVIRFI